VSTTQVERWSGDSCRRRQKVLGKGKVGVLPCCVKEAPSGGVDPSGDSSQKKILGIEAQTYKAVRTNQPRWGSS